MPKQYFKTHEWIEKLASNQYRMGISKYACDQLGDIVFIEEKTPVNEYEAGESLAILESVKAVGDIYAAMKVKLIQTNPDIVANPESLTQDTWVVELSSDEDLTSLELLDETKYQEYLTSI